MTVHDKLESSGSRAVWPEVLAVYAVKVNTDPNNPQDVASMDNAKIAILEEIFWAMNQINSRVETAEETVIIEDVDEEGNIIETETTQIITTLYINVTHKTAMTMTYEYIQTLMVVNAISFEGHRPLLRSLTTPRIGIAHSSHNIPYTPCRGAYHSVGKRSNCPHCGTARPPLPVAVFGTKRHEEERVFGVFLSSVLMAYCCSSFKSLRPKATHLVIKPPP